jgi:superfamily I DNA and/or RNA helicase
VRKLRAALPPGMRVGSVDKFQGQEAPVVIVSMCASPGETGGRGLAFVLDQNRLNVALSRAQSLAIVVGDPRLVESGCGRIADMRRLNLYCWIQEAGGPGATSG